MGELRDLMEGAAARDGMTLVGIETRASNDRGDLLGAHWQRLLSERVIERVEGRLDDTVVAVYRDYEGDHTQPYTFFLGFRVADAAAVPEGMARRSIGEGPYAHVIAEGEQPQALIHAWMKIWDLPLDRRYEADYEIHDPDGEKVDIYVGVNA
jgi:predicted transcriptional regulator YdeE